MVRLDPQKLRLMRQLKGFNQAKLAAAAEVSFSYIGHLERGTREAVSPAVYMRICDALDIKDRTELMAGVESSGARQ